MQENDNKRIKGEVIFSCSAEFYLNIDSHTYKNAFDINTREWPTLNTIDMSTNLIINNLISFHITMDLLYIFHSFFVENMLKVLFCDLFCMFNLIGAWSNRRKQI